MYSLDRGLNGFRRITFGVTGLRAVRGGMVVEEEWVGVRGRRRDLREKSRSYVNFCPGTVMNRLRPFGPQCLLGGT